MTGNQYCRHFIYLNKKHDKYECWEVCKQILLEYFIFTNYRNARFWILILPTFSSSASDWWTIETNRQMDRSITREMDKCTNQLHENHRMDRSGTEKSIHELIGYRKNRRINRSVTGKIHSLTDRLQKNQRTNQSAAEKTDARTVGYRKNRLIDRLATGKIQLLTDRLQKNQRMNRSVTEKIDARTGRRQETSTHWLIGYRKNRFSDRSATWKSTYQPIGYRKIDAWTDRLQKNRPTYRLVPRTVNTYTNRLPEKSIWIHEKY